MLGALAEENQQLRADVMDCASAIDGLVRVLSLQVHVQEGLQKKLQKRRREDLDDRTSPYVQSVDPKDES